MLSIFPFTAIVGQDRMKRALILNAINPQIGGVLIRGERGTAKSTAARALADLLPEIKVVADCPFACNPDKPERFCDNCRERAAAGEELALVERRTKFVNLPVSATEDRVVGTLDIEKAIKQGERRFEPGVLAAANRGVLYVDEVNLLDDHVVDLLLDSAAMGINVVEREGISFSHPARFVFVGSMNPEEGDLRPQLLDRFALCVDIQSINNSHDRVSILERSLEYERDAARFYQTWLGEEETLSRAIGSARTLLPQVKYTPQDLKVIAELMAEMEVDGHRGDIVILKAALTHAAFEGRTQINTHDILIAAELTLPHRLRRRPFQDTEAQMAALSERLEEIRSEVSQEADMQLRPDDAAAESQEKKTILTG
ncbi:MAG: ATP-binding protein [Anaerolineae bacterium]